uniref:Uncharacterized protein n=1 Tax=Lotus japonicus TaxID=34305 RepID=I3SBR6_LOTJA|nr:unknown [Lotus japonicus]
MEIITTSLIRLILMIHISDLFNLNSTSSSTNSFLHMFIFFLLNHPGNRLLLFNLESGDRKCPVKPSRSLKCDLSGRRIIHIDVIECDPNQKLLGLHTGELLDLPNLNIGSDLSSIRNQLANLLKLVSVAFLLLQPHETAFTVVTAFLYVFQWKKAIGEGYFLQQFLGFLLAEKVSMVDL